MMMITGVPTLAKMTHMASEETPALETFLQARASRPECQAATKVV